MSEGSGLGTSAIVLYSLVQQVRKLKGAVQNKDIINASSCTGKKKNQQKKPTAHQVKSTRNTFG